MTIERAARAPTWVLVVVALATFGVGATVRLACDPPCRSDIAGLYIRRGVRPDAPPYIDRNLEYPVVVGGVFYAATFVASTPRSVYVAVGVAAGALAGLVAWLLAERRGRRAWWWVLAPPLALYGSLNFDLVAIAPAVGGLVAFESGWFALAGVLLAVGAAAKLYPGAILLVLVVDRLAVRDFRGTRRLLGAAAATFVALNLPVVVASPEGWWWPFRFQAERRATWGSLWHYVGRAPPDLHRWMASGVERRLVDVGAFAALAIGIVIVARQVWRRAIDPIAAAGIVTAVFLLANKVYSPQYDLWLVPFFALVATPWRRIAAFFVVDAAVYALVSTLLEHNADVTLGWRRLLAALVVARAIAIAALAMAWWQQPLPRADPSRNLASDPERSDRWASWTGRSR